MSNIITKPQISAHELALVQNDLSKLNPQERLSLYNKTCESLGLNPLTQPFGYIEFRGGKLSLYAKKDCTDQLRKIHGVSVEITSKETIADNFVVMARAKDMQGRVDEDMGSVNLKGLSGEALGNAMMKAITKAKRRVTLSICGLGMLDEMETETIKDAKVIEDKTASAGSDNKQNSEIATTPPTPPQENIVINHAIPEPPEQRFYTQEQVDTYKLTFKFNAFKEGMTFAQLGKNDAKQLLLTVQSWRLKFDSEGKPMPNRMKEFIELAKLYLGRFDD